MNSEELVYLTREPINAETPLERQVGAITPTPRHYVRDHFAIPEAPTRLAIDGAVRTPLRLVLDDLRSLPPMSLVVTLECAGNGRAFLDPPAAGEQWRTGAVGTAEWTGASLRTVLEMAGPLASAVELLCVGADAGIPAGVGTRVAYERSLPIVDAMRDDTLLAYAMNGSDLPPEHGAPLRLIVPGWYGMASVKWLARLSVLERTFDGFFQAKRYIVGDRPLREIAPRALITRPREGERLAARPFVARGYAWSGRSDLARVELSADGGRSWNVATLGDALSRYAWRQWHATIAPPGSGELALLARAVTTGGATQPLDEVRTTLGYENNAARPVRIEIA
ncbi:MAG TPA: sulfite oxidase [Candidatus Limnocylindria bacterium]|jgi:DMSO/TMAO reductase YedYZ molybdopterin-dependent catalytic subunit|nr:sulfite oxidase [Candidatus Limnocylindria bacterium]